MKACFLIITCISLAALLAFSDRFEKESPDKKFVLSAADGGMLEVKLGELAIRQGTKAKTKEFGKMMITDHNKANNELKTLASKKKIEIPAKLSNTKQQIYDSLAVMSGEKFDMLYMNMMIASHEETVGLFQTESTSGKDPEFKKWADSKIPSLKHHLEMSKQLFSSESQPTKSNGN
ncbi:DUF4142 domain-containing protein [Dyadobacter sp. CY345]|uniref:DUF4142 domain-containing protein n=1 Tax=Dyadobacter sp. CY345 TaxID=2909335 RepID=UPI001F306143|nr:DUF4142 domain-containing protein [Dyadobacter sp. CY345]MCF2446678.1 DUF4142 domain-containing protein [Dyadobacter sp. CY345]